VNAFTALSSALSRFVADPELRHAPIRERIRAAKQRARDRRARDLLTLAEQLGDMGEYALAERRVLEALDLDKACAAAESAPKPALPRVRAEILAPF
jgi:hypothetical protein